MVRTRFAPSPTGYMHIGNLRTALYEYLIAKSQGGKFVLRIEDTDQERFIEGATDVIYNTLTIAGLRHDEGPDIGGEYGPYIQSSRKNVYLEYAKKLVEIGNAYYCFCSKERLMEVKQLSETEDVIKYDRHCLSLSSDDIESRLEMGQPYVIRQKMPSTGSTTFTDVVFGDITVDNEILDDQILIKSDGLPTYNFANVVDDHLMKITHVVRGSEYLSSTPKYKLLYDAFGWENPTYIHLPPVMKNQTEKLSKRKGDASFEDLLKMGFLPQAIINFIALLGWSPSENREFFTLDELIDSFSIDGLSKSPAIFDMVKLSWMNGEYFKKMDFDKFHNIALPIIKDTIKTQMVDLKKISRLIQSRIQILNDIPEMVGFIEKLPDYELDLYFHKKMKTNREIALSSLEAAVPLLTDVIDWSENTLHDSLLGLVAQLGIKNGQMLWPVRTALSGKPTSPGGAIELLDILGKDESLKRINVGIEKLREDCL